MSIGVAAGLAGKEKGRPWLVFEGKEKDFIPSLQIFIACDHLHTFPQSIVNSSSTKAIL